MRAVTMIPNATPKWLRVVGLAITCVAALPYAAMLFAGHSPALAGLQLPVGIATVIVGLPTIAVLGPLTWLLPQRGIMLHLFPAWQMHCLLMWFAVALNWLVVLPWIYVGASKLLTRSKSK